MEKRISYSQFQSVKCVAKACDPLLSKRIKLKEKLDKLTKEYEDCNTQISSLEAGIISVIGFPVDALVKKVIEPGIDVNGLPKKTTKYLPTDIVSYDEKHKQYIISVNNEPKEAITEPQDIVNESKSSVYVEEAPNTPQTESTVEDTMPVDTPVFE
nr:MAG TPA: hypothetical protein [Crassvirales sp.]